MTPDPRPTLCLDPSSSAVGWALFRPDGTLGDFGRWTSSKKDANARIVAMCDDLYDLLEEERPGTAVVEDCDGQIGRGVRGGGGRGIDVYGKAVGMVLGMLRWGPLCVRPDIHPVGVRKWTRGVPKADRLLWVRAKHPRYDLAADPGGDAGDAIALGEWWLTERRLATAKEMATK